MLRRQPPRLSLTNRLLALGALIVLITTALLLITSSAGVYEMAVRQEQERQTAYREMFAADLSGWFASAGRAARSMATLSSLTATDTQAMTGALATAVNEAEPWVLGAVLTDPSDGWMTGWARDGQGVIDDPPSVVRSETEGLSFVWQTGSGDPSGGRLWVVAPVRLAEGPPRLLKVLLGTAPVVALLDEVAEVSGSACVVVFDSDGSPLFVSTDALLGDRPTYTFTADAGDVGKGRLRAGGTASHVGYYTTLEPPTGPGWRVGVLEESEQAWRETWSALRPGILGWAVALGAALAASMTVVGRVTRPLRQLEIRARALASGARIEPAEVEQDDEVGRLLEALNSVARRLDRLGDIAELLARASDRSLVLEGVTSSIAHMLGPVDVDVLLLSEEGDLELVAAEGVLANGRHESVLVPEVQWVADALASGEPVTTVPDGPDPLVELHGRTHAAVLAVPLRAGDDVIGAVVVVREQDHGFREGEIETVRSFAAQASVALHTSRLFEDERRSRTEAEALRAIAERITSPLTLEDTLSEVGIAAADLVGLERAVVVLEEPDRFGFSGTPDVAAQDWLAAWQETGRQTSDGPVVFERPDVVPAARRALDAARAGSALLVPLVIEDAHVGLLVMTTSRAHVRMDAHRLALADTVGKQASLALQNADLYEQAARRADNLETIFRISYAVGSSLQSRIVLNRVLDVVQKILSADAVMLLTYDARRKIMSVPMARGILHHDMLEATFRPGEDVPGRVFETREPERFDRLDGADTKLLNAAAAQGLQSLLAVPLLARGRSIGVLAAFATGPGAFTGDDLDLLRTFASQAALAIDTAELFSREHHVATVLQQSILPSTIPRVPGIETHSVYLPAFGDAEIGGDYYDLFIARDGRVAITIGDVCGKGVEAATKTSMIKYAIRGMAAAGLQPSEIVEQLNAMIIESGDPSGIVTVWVGYLDTATGELTYANGGHPPPLVFDASSGAIERLTTTGALLGAVSDARWNEARVTLAPGASLLLYTDGVTEARSGIRFFGEGRVRRALRQGGSAAEITQRLLASVQRFAAGDLRDDAAILTVVRSD